MIQHRDHFHGSDLEKIEEIYHVKKEEVVSFSANVNPLGISPVLREELSSHVDCISSYPDREYASLKKSIAAYVGCDPAHILVGNGTTELISLFIEHIHPKRALILGPTYSEYERSISLVGGKCSYYPLREENGFAMQVDDFIGRLSDAIDLIVLCNPNNPTSSLIDRGSMRRILDACKEHHVYALVDETYIEFAEDVAAVSAIRLTKDYNNVIILRGTSKFFAAPGLRLGYAVIGNPDVYRSIEQHKNPWMISSLAQVAGEIMFSDDAYIQKTRALISGERERLYRFFKESGRFTPFVPHANFMLLKINEPSLSSGILFDRAIREKMMIRDCSTFPFLSDRYIRVCFMMPKDNDRLTACLMKD